MRFLLKTLPHSSILPNLILRCIRKFEVGNQIICFTMVCNLHIQPPFFVLNCLQIRIKELSPSSFTTTSASTQMSQPHMLYFSRCAFPLKYKRLPKCLHLQFTTYQGAKSRCTGRCAAYNQKPAGFSLRSDNNTGHSSRLLSER